MSIGGRLLLYGNPNGYEVAEHIDTKVQVYPQMLSTLKNDKSIWSMNPGEDFETSVVGPLGILVALVKRYIGQGSSNSGRFFGRPSMSRFLAIRLSLVIETWPKTPMNKLRDSLFLKSTDSWDNNILISVSIDIDNFELKIVKIVVSLVWWSTRKTLRVNKVTMLKRFRFNL